MMMQQEAVGSASSEPTTAREILQQTEDILVKQKPQWLESFTCCEFENKYNVYQLQGGSKGKKLFKCREKSSFVSRHCLPPDCRPFDVAVLKKKPQKGPFLRFERECKCTCLCCNRPEIKVYYVENSHPDFEHGGKIMPTDQDEYIGKVVDPWHCCNMTMETFDDEGNKHYYVSAYCCQWGIYCHLPCGPCKRVSFKIMDTNGEEVGEIAKVWSSCLKEFLSDADNFEAHFPAKADWKQKALLLAATLLIDFRYFEKNEKQNQ